VLYANRRVDDLKDRSQGLRILNGRVFANHPRDAPKLRRLVAELSDVAAAEPDARRIASIMLGDGGHGDLFVMASILSPGLPFFGLSCPAGALLLLVGEAEQTRALDPGILKDLYGLTRAESRIAAELAKGTDLARICARFSISCNTARSQLRSVFRKTRTASQPELVSRLLAGPFFRAA
jgi:DNA-binding CsgD family transcriptional regulator